MWSETISRSKPRPSTVWAQRASVSGLVPGPKFGTFTPSRTGSTYRVTRRPSRPGAVYLKSEQLRTPGHDAPLAGPLTRPDVSISEALLRGLDVFRRSEPPEGGCDDRAADLYHHHDPVRQRAPAYRVRARAGAGRRAGPLPPRARGQRQVPGRDR